MYVHFKYALRIKQRQTVVCILWMLASSIAAATVGFKSYMSVDGLSDNRVLCALQDSYGFMWLGTDNGLNCYDGQRNTIYRNMVSSGIAFEHNQITSLLELDDDIWFGGSFGLYVYHRASNTFTRFSTPTRYGVLVSSTVDKMMRTQNDYIWICTQGQGLFLYQPKTGILTQDSRHNGFISDMTVGIDGMVYLVSLDGHLMVYSQDGQFQRQYDVPDFVVDKNKMCVENVGSRVFIGCDQGLFRLNAETDAVERVSESSLFVRALLAQEAHLLVGTDHGLYDYDVNDGSMMRIDDPASSDWSFSDDCINGLFTSKDGTLWVLTEHGGVNFQSAQPAGLVLTPMPEYEGSTRNIVHAFCQMHDGRLWIGSDAGLFVQEVDDPTIRRPAVLTTQIEEISCLMEDGDDLWIGTQHSGLYILNTITGELRHHVYSDNRPYTIASNEVYSLLRTRGGDIYVGTSWGLRRYDRQRNHFMFFAQINSMTGFMGIVEDKNGTIWAASDGHGLFYKRASDADFSSFLSKADNPRSLPNNAITSVACDSRGNVWVATKGGGFCRYVPATNDFERIGGSDMLLQREQIYFIQEDKEQGLWLGTDGGFIRINPDYTVLYDALSTPEEQLRAQKPWNASCCTADGIVHIGYNNEMIAFDPAKLKNYVQRLPLYITHISFPHMENTLDELNRLGINHMLYTTESIRLPYADNHFTLFFASPHYNGRAQIHYEYTMRGFDKTWARGSDNNNEATYSNLPPGSYEFMLREVGDENPEHYAHLRITILSPWYRTPWAYAAYVLLFLLAVFMVFRYSNRRIRNRFEARMEEYRLLQEKENFQSKINFFINLVHEIRTPLSLINLPLEQMEEGELSDDNRNHVHAIRRNTNYLLGITNQLLDFQKAESGGGINLQLSSCDVGQLLDGIYRQFKDPMKVQGESLQLQQPTTPITTTLDRDKISKVLMNLLGNALKYAKSEVIIRLDQDDEDRFSISIIDDGPGVPPAERDRIFDVYYQIAGDSTAAHLGTGLGLSYAKMLAKAHGGNIEYQDAVGGGSNFTLTLPIRQDMTAMSELKEPEMATVASENTETMGEKRSFRILLVEDNDELLNATAEGLRKWFFVMKAQDGVEALDVLRHHEVDVIVSDVMMPRMDGNELCRQLKSDINYSHLPIILLTAKTTVEAKLEGMQSGADIYLEKPFSLKQLHLQIVSLLRMRQSFYERMRQVDGAQSIIIAESEFGMNQQDIQFMARLQELVRQNMRDEEFSIDILAEQMNMSRSSFYRKIKALTDMTPVDYMKTQRLERAAQLLRQGQRITEVADQVGFTSSSYFAKCFRAKFGVLPKDYINSLKENISERTDETSA